MASQKLASAASTASVLAVAALTTATLTATAAPAAAASGGSFGTVYSLAYGTCVAQVEPSVTGDAYPEHAAFTVSTIMFGAGDCTLPVTLTWRNLDTGQIGTVTRTPTGPGYWVNDGRSALFSPGVGRFSATVTVGAAHIPDLATVEFTVSEYRP